MIRDDYSSDNSSDNRSSDLNNNSERNGSGDNYTDQQLRKAVALFYDGNNAPSVSAKGIGEEADLIMAVAREHGIPLCDNAALVDLLVTLELGDNIPESLYIAVAHIIAFAYELQGKVPEGFTPAAR